MCSPILLASSNQLVQDVHVGDLARRDAAAAPLLVFCPKYVNRPYWRRENPNSKGSRLTGIGQLFRAEVGFVDGTADSDTSGAGFSNGRSGSEGGQGGDDGDDGEFHVCD